MSAPVRKVTFWYKSEKPGAAIEDDYMKIGPGGRFIPSGTLSVVCDGEGVSPGFVRLTRARADRFFGRRYLDWFRKSHLEASTRNDANV